MTCSVCGTVYLSEFGHVCTARFSRQSLPPVKNLTPGEFASLEKNAELRAEIGRLRASILMAKDVLDQGGSESEASARHILSVALGLEP